jgi:hypothetical protein
LISRLVTPSAISFRRALARGEEEGAVARGARRRDGRADAAAGVGDVLVARALEAQLELARPLAAVDEVRVAVDEAGRDELAGELVLGVDGHARGQVGVEPTQRMTSSSATSAPRR